MNYKRVFIQNSIVFVTVVTHSRRPILIENIEALEDAINNKAIL
jgi:REP element-mobilizing transposase RayT